MTQSWWLSTLRSGKSSRYLSKSDIYLDNKSPAVIIFRYHATISFYFWKMSDCTESFETVWIFKSACVYYFALWIVQNDLGLVYFTAYILHRTRYISWLMSHRSWPQLTILKLLKQIKEMIYALTVESVQFEISKGSFNLSLITLNSTEIRFFFDEFLIDSMLTE